MPLIAQDDSGAVAGANSYADRAYADAYFSDRNNSEWSGLADQAKESGLILATDYIDSKYLSRFVGARLSDDQYTEWPRNGAVGNDGRTYSGIPDRLKKASVEYALRAATTGLNKDPVVDESGLTVKSKKEKTGPLEEEVVYQDGVSHAAMNKFPAADLLMRPLLMSDFKLIRA
jgi:Putative DnaT-like ssDNA binding protein